ncbi:MAG: DCC1-like thiol-disulfide oxidoreductase family protein [Gemmatimonadota bacterium]
MGKEGRVEGSAWPTGPLAHRPTLLLYDGTCGFCASSVQWVLRRDRRGTLRFAALQGETARPILARHPELANVDSVVWVEGSPEAHEAQKALEVVRVRSAAALAVGRYLGGGWSVVARLAALIPRVLRDPLYDLIARHRHKLTRNGPECLVPSPNERVRFLP